MQAPITNTIGGSGISKYGEIRLVPTSVKVARLRAKVTELSWQWFSVYV